MAQDPVSTSTPSDSKSSDHDDDTNSDARQSDSGKLLRHERMKRRIEGFKYQQTEAWRTITNRFGHDISLRELVSIALLLAQTCYLKVDRDAKRSKQVVIKWFEENWDIVRPFLDYVVLAEIPPGNKTVIPS